MADHGSATEDAMEIVEEGEVESGEVTPSPEKELPFLPGFPSLQEYSKVCFNAYCVTVIYFTSSAGPDLPGDSRDQGVQSVARRGR